MDITKIKNTRRIEDVRWQEVEGVCDLFARDEVTILGEHSRSAAQDLAGNQPKNHAAALRLITDLSKKWGQPIGINIPDRLLQSLIPRIIEQTRFEFDDEKKGTTLRAANGTPIISDDNLNTFRERFEAPPGMVGRGYVINFMGLLLAAYLRATRTSGVEWDFSQLGSIASSVRSGFAKIEAYYMLHVQPEALKQPMDDLNTRADEMKVRLANFDRMLGNEGERILEMQGRYEALDQYGQEFETKANQFDEKFEALRKSIEERLKLQDARKLWGQRGIQSAWAFYVSGVILIAVLSLIPITAFWYRGDVLEYMQRMELTMLAGAGGNSEIAATVSALGRLLLISAPLGFVVWLVRIIVRYNIRSMLLMDDARQRVTMLNTYLFLIEQDAAVKQDRGAILEALFRRAPGHGGDTVEPPHFTDLLRYGQENFAKTP